MSFVRQADVAQAPTPAVRYLRQAARRPTNPYISQTMAAEKNFFSAAMVCECRDSSAFARLVLAAHGWCWRLSNVGLPTQTHG